MVELSFRNTSARTLPKNPPTSLRAIAAAQYYGGNPPPSAVSFRFLATRKPSPRFDEVFRKAGHNSYETQYSTSIASALENTKSIEIDFYDQSDMIFGGESFQGYWYVRHAASGGNDNCCSGKGGLAICLRDVNQWSNSHPNHEPVTVFLDKKQAWGDSGEKRSPGDLDKLILDSIPLQKLFRPADLRGEHLSLRRAARNGAWPQMNELRGRILFVITGGQLLNTNRTQSQYLASRGTGAVCFVAPDTDAETDVTGSPNQFDEDQVDSIVFFNLKSGNENLARRIRREGCMSRLWGANENDTTYKQLIASGVNFIALYHVQRTDFNDGAMEGELAIKD